ncbi:unnamed protein product, partial [Porites lobata]
IPQTITSVKRDMKIKLTMNGNVNGHEFTIEGNGKGTPYDGTQTINLKVTSGGPLPFAYDILTNAFQYGNRAFTQYPKEIPDYFKQTFPEGYSWERTMEFADGGTCEVKSVIRLVKYKTCSAQYLSRSFKSFSSLIYNRFHALDKEDKGCFVYKILFTGKFPEDGPVMRKNVLRWEPSTETMYMNGGELKGDINHALLLEDGSDYRCNFKSIYK